MKLLTLLLAGSLAAIGSPARHFEQNRGQAGTNANEVQFIARDRAPRVAPGTVVLTPLPLANSTFPGQPGTIPLTVLVR